MDDHFLTDGVMVRRIVAWAIDAVLIAVLVWLLWWLLLMFGFLTLGYGLGALSVLPAVPFCYQFLSLISASNATPGQRMLDLVVRRDNDLGPPTGFQALLFVIVYDVTLATSGLLLVIALFTVRHRTLHDLVSGLVVVRARALTAVAERWNMYGGTPVS